MQKFIIFLATTVSFISFSFGTIEIQKRYSPVILQENIVEHSMPSQNGQEDTVNFINFDSLRKTLPVQDISLQDIELKTKLQQTFDNKLTATDINNNLVIFGHNWPNMLGDLKKVKKGDKISVKTLASQEKGYVVTGTYEVYPNETHVLTGTGNAERLTIITCSGFMDSKRLVVTAKRLQS